jgi:mannosyltransferase
VLVVLSPLLLLAQHQKGQIEFLAGRKVLDAHQIIDVQWFRSAPFSWIAWGLIVLAVLSPAIRAVWGTTRQGDRWIAPLLCWMLLPMLILGSVSLVYTPVFTQRYVTNSAGAVALLLVFGVHELRVPARWMRGLLRRERECRIWGTVATAGVRGVVVVCALLLLIPNLVQVREGTEMHRHADWNRVAAVVGQYSHRGDAVLYDSVVRQSWSPRNIAHVYPSDFSGLHDVGLRTPYWKTGGLWDVSVPLSEVPARVRPYERVWTIQVRASRGAAALQDVMTPLGYSAEKTWRFSLDTVTLWTRG